MFSERARRYLASLERRAHVDDMGLVRDLLIQHGVPAKEAFLEFHAALAGYVEPAGNDELVYGIVHPRSYWHGSLAPAAEEHEGIWFIVYADCHPSYEREMDDRGVLYEEGRVARAGSFQMLVEQHAFIWEFWQAGPASREIVRAPAGDVKEMVFARMDQFRIRELCDSFSTVWADEHYRLLAVEGASWLLWRRPGAEAPSLEEMIELAYASAPGHDGSRKAKARPGSQGAQSFEGRDDGPPEAAEHGLASLGRAPRR